MCLISQRRDGECVKISDHFGFDVDPDAIVEDLPVGVQQRVEIIKALSRDAGVRCLTNQPPFYSAINR